MIFNIDLIYLSRLLLSGILIAFVTAPLGCLLVWKRLSFVADSLGHSALFAVSIALLLGFFPIYLSIILFCFLIIFLLKKYSNHLPTDAILLCFSYGALSAALLLFHFLPTLSYNVQSFLFGDLLLVSDKDIFILLGILLFLIIILYKNWNSLVFETFSPELAKAEGLSSPITDWAFFLLLSLCISVGLKLLGGLLLPSILILPATTACLLSDTPLGILKKSVVISLFSFLLGIFFSIFFDLPIGPSITFVCFIFFLLGIFLIKKFSK